MQVAYIFLVSKSFLSKVNKNDNMIKSLLTFLWTTFVLVLCNNCKNCNVTGVDFEDTTPDIMGYINQVVAETNQGTNNS